MNKLKQLYSISIDGNSQGSEEAVKRKEAYAKQKRDYLIRCKEERKSRYSFWQRNKIFIVLASFLVVTISGISCKCFIESKSIKNRNELDEIVNPSDIVAEEKNESLFVTDENNTNEKQVVTADTGDNADAQQATKDEAVNINAEKQTIIVGMEVNFIGSIHYESSYSTAQAIKCSSGKAVVTKINQNGVHPYHLESCEKSCTVYGWVDVEDIEMIDVLE